MKIFALLLIRFYQKFVSPAAKIIWPGGSCRFSPTCSEYTYQAVDKYGFVTGGGFGLRRIIRCHPYSKGDRDPIS